MKAILKTLLGFSLLLCLTTGCDWLGYDDIETEQASGGKTDEEPCKDDC